MYMLIVFILAISKALGSVEQPGLPVQQPSNLMAAIATVVEEAMGGSSGAVSLITRVLVYIPSLMSFLK